MIELPWWLVIYLVYHLAAAGWLLNDCSRDIDDGKDKRPEDLIFACTVGPLTMLAMHVIIGVARVVNFFRPPLRQPPTVGGVMSAMADQHVKRRDAQIDR